MEEGKGEMKTAGSVMVRTVGRLRRQELGTSQ